MLNHKWIQNTTDKPLMASHSKLKSLTVLRRLAYTVHNHRARVERSLKLPRPRSKKIAGDGGSCRGKLLLMPAVCACCAQAARRWKSGAKAIMLQRHMILSCDED